MYSLITTLLQYEYTGTVRVLFTTTYTGYTATVRIHWLQLEYYSLLTTLLQFEYSGIVRVLLTTNYTATVRVHWYS